LAPEIVPGLFVGGTMTKGIDNHLFAYLTNHLKFNAP